MMIVRATRLACGLGCSQVPLRFFTRQTQKLDRFSRDHVRSRLHRQEIKEIVKQPQQQTDAFISKDSIPVRPSSHLWKGLAFTLGVGATAFTVASISDYERVRRYVKTGQLSISNFFQRQQEKIPAAPSEGELAAIALVAANLVVTLLWRVRALHPAMWQYFTNSFASRSLCLPMALSVFSHSSLLHFALNMYVLYTFAHISIDKFLGVDQFTAFYLSAGIASSLTSLAHKAAVRSPIRALGASGAILALLTYTCCKIPDARLKIVFIPWFEFSAESAVIGIVLFDLAGLLFRFKLFDHAAHLGGSAIGILYALWGEELLWGHFRGFVQRKWQYITQREL